MKRIGPILLTLYAIWFFVLGASYIYFSNRSIDLKFLVAGSPTLAAGQTNLLRIWASQISKDFDFSEYQISYNLACPEIEEKPIQGAIPLNAQGEALLKITPSPKPCSAYTLDFSLIDENDRIVKAAELQLAQTPILPVSTKNTAPLFLETLIQNPFFPSKQSEIKIFASHNSGTPFRDKIELALRYGSGVIPESVTPNIFGIASFNASLLSQVDLELSLLLYPEKTYQRYLSLPLLEQNLLITLPKTFTHSPHSPLQIQFQSLAGDNTVYCDVFYQNAWIGRSVMLTDSTNPSEFTFQAPNLPAPAILSLNCCLSDWACAENTNKINVFYTDKPLEHAQIIEFLHETIKTQIPDHPLTQLLNTQSELLTQASIAERIELIDYLRMRIPNNTTKIEVLLRSDSIEQAQINSEKSTHKFAANILFFITIAIGLLILLALFLQGKKRANQLRLELDLDDQPETSLEKKAKTLQFLSLIAMLLAIAIMLIGVFYIFQIL